jgi:hypothetical protein
MEWQVGALWCRKAEIQRKAKHAVDAWLASSRWTTSNPLYAVNLGGAQQGSIARTIALALMDDGERE